MRKGRVFRGAFARALLLAAAGLLSSVSGVTENREEARPVIFSDWQSSATDSAATETERVGSFTIGKPKTEKFIGGLFEEWRDLIQPEFGRFDPLARRSVRDKLFFNRDSIDFHEYLRGRREDLLLRFNRVSADYLTGRLTERAETGASGLSFVRNVEVDYQSSLGKRRWQSGVNVLGALRETADDAIVWQLRGYAAKESSAGGNVGLIYRHVVGEETLMGANVFFDYESHDYGDFLRWSYGGEWRGGWGGFHVNRYVPISDAEELSDGGTAYTQGGVDAAAEFTVPRLRWISGGLTYYKWKGEFEQPDDKGFRYHGAFDFSRLFGGGDFWGGLSFLVEYDSPHKGDNDWGWKLAYRHRFDAPAPTGSSEAEASFDPRERFFDPVRREYAQRIKVKKEPKDEVVATLVAGSAELQFATETTPVVLAKGEVETYSYRIFATVSVATGAEGILDLTAPAWKVRVFEAAMAQFLEKGERLHLSQGMVHVQGSDKLREITTPSVAIGLEGQANLTVGHPYEVTETRVLGTVTTTVTRAVSYVDVSEGGLSIVVGTRIAAAREAAAVLASSVLKLSVSPPGGTVTINSPGRTVIVDGIVKFTMTVIPVVKGQTIEPPILAATGGYRDGYRYSVTAPAGLTVDEAGSVSFVGAGGISSVGTMTVRVEDGFSEPVVTVVRLEPRERLVVADSPATIFVRPTDAPGSPILTLSVSGGKEEGAYAYRVEGDTGVAIAGGTVSFTRAGADGDVRRVVLVVADEDGFQPERRDLAVVFDRGISVSAEGMRVAADYTGIVQTVAASSRRGTVQFSSGTEGVSVGSTDGVVSLTGSVAAGSRLVVAITIEALRAGVTVKQTVDQTVVLLTLEGVAVFDPGTPGTLYAQVSAAVGGVLGRLPRGSVFGVVSDPQGWVGVEAGNGDVRLRTSPTAASTVVVTLFAGDGAVGNNRPVTVTVVFWDALTVAGRVDRFAPSVAGGVYHTVMPSGGSGVYDFSLVETGGGTVALTETTGSSSGVSVSIGLSVTLTVVAEVRDALISRSPPAPVRTTVVFVGIEGLVFSGLLPRYFVPVGGASGAVHTIQIVGGEPPYTVVESPEAADFRLTPQSILIFSGATGTPALFAVTLIATDSDADDPKAATVRAEVSVYAPVRVSPATVTQTISSEWTGGVYTVTAATAGSGNYDYAVLPGSGQDVAMAEEVLVLNASLATAATLTVHVRVTEAGAGYGGETADMVVILVGILPLRATAFASPLVVEPDLVVGDTVLTLSVSGGLGDYRYAILTDSDLVVNTLGVVRLSSEDGEEGTTRVGTVVVTDETDFNALSLTVSVRFRVTSVLSFVPENRYAPAANAGGTTPLTLAALSVTGGSPPVIWAETSDVEGVVSIAADGRVIVTALLDGGLRAEVGVSVRDSRGLTDTGTFTVHFYRPLTLFTDGLVTATVRGGYTGELLEIDTAYGAGVLAYSVAAAPASLTAAVDGAGKVSLLSPLGERETATLTVEVADPLGGERATVVVVLELNRAGVLRASPESAELVLSPGYGAAEIAAGFLAIYTVNAEGGQPPYEFEQLTPPVDGVALDESSGRILLTKPLTTEMHVTITVRVRDAPKENALFRFVLRVANSLAFTEEALYVAGGYVGRNRNDVWRSANGRDWEELTANGGFDRVQHMQMATLAGSLWLVGGYNGSEYFPQLWRSADGRSWTKVSSDSRFGRAGHQVLSWRGSLWLVGGQSKGGYQADVWRSADGERWDLVTATAAFQGRAEHRLAVHGDRLWLVAGRRAAPGAHNGVRQSDVWVSDDGERWTEVASDAGFEERNDFGLVSSGGSLWVIGGGNYKPIDYFGVSITTDVGLNDVWVSGNGRNWTEVDQTAGFQARINFKRVVHTGGYFWLMGGSDFVLGEFADVWRSADAANWQRVTDSAGFGTRQNHALAKFRRAQTPFIHEVVEIVPGAVARQTVFKDAGTPLTLATLTATGGVGELRFDLTHDSHTVAAVSPDGVLTVVKMLAHGETATVSVEVADTTPVNRATVAVTLVYVAKPLSLASSSAEYELTPDYVGVVHRLSPTGGDGDYSFERVTGPTAVVANDAGELAVESALSEESTVAVFTVRDGENRSLRFTLNLRIVAIAPEDYPERMYLIGGVDGDAINDVWRSEDGENWNLVTASAAFSARYQHQSAVFDGSLWVVGGNSGGSEVWRSADGENWNLVTASAAFAARRFHQLVAFGGNLWVLGGYVGGSANDEIWRSADGENWTRVTPSGQPFTARFGHQAVSPNGGALFVIGGSNGGLRNDVWASADGESWGALTGDAGFAARSGHQVAELGGTLWLVGGASAAATSFGDVWWSTDSINWTEATGTTLPPSRTNHQLVAFGGSLWIVGGAKGFLDPGVDTAALELGDVWVSGDGRSWRLVTDAPAFGVRDRHQVVAFRSLAPFVREIKGLEVTPPAVLTVVAGDGTATLATLMASGGKGALVFSLAADARGVASVSADGVLVATAFLDAGERATVSVVVSDSETPPDRVVVAVTLAFVEPLVISPGRARYMVSPGFSGVLHTLAASGGTGGYSYALVSGTTALTVDADSGVVSLATGLVTEGSEVTAAFVARDSSGASARFTLILRVAIVEAMYLSGGNNGTDLGDVWRSTDGVIWERTAATAFSGRRGHEMVSHGASLLVVGGALGRSFWSDVWASADGMSWDLVDSAPAFGEVALHQMVSHDNSLFLSGGVVDSRFSQSDDVWRSESGRTWVQATSAAAFGTRSNHQMVSHDNSLWMVGGSRGSTKDNQVWRSADGQDWQRVPVSGNTFSGRSRHRMVSHGGSLWVVGGSDTSNSLVNDVWRSTDGRQWEQVSAGVAAFAGRDAFELVSYRGSMWFVGGLAGGRYRSDVWASANGRDWEQVTADGGFPGRNYHQLAVFRPAQEEEFVRRVTDIVVTAPGTLTLAAGASEPVTLATLQVSGGFGAPRFEVTRGARFVSVSADGVLVATSFLNEAAWSAVVVLVRDSTPTNRAEAAIALRFVEPLTVSPTSGLFVVTPDYAGGVASLTVSGGLGAYRFARATGDAALTVVAVNSSVAAVSLVSPLAAGTMTAVFVVRDEFGGVVSVSVDLLVRAGYVGEFDERLVLIGGEDDGSRQSDVWLSENGAEWMELTDSAGFDGRYLHQAAALGGSLFVVGGTGNDNVNRNDVWASRDGEGWGLVTTAAVSLARSGAQVVAYRGSLWLIGGTQGNARFNDVWRSADGKNWQEVRLTRSFLGRSGHRVAVFGGSLWVIGGQVGDSAYEDDVWASVDGASWREVTGAAAFTVRFNHQVAAHGGSLWVIGGSDGTSNLRDVWRSANGQDWEQVTATAAFSARSGHQVAVYGGRLWVVGGDSGGRLHDVWHSENGADWTEVTAVGGKFSARNFHQVAVFRPPEPFSRMVEDVAMVPPGVVTVVLDKSLPITVTRLRATGGATRLRFSVVADAAGVAAVRADGALAVTAALGNRQTATVTVRATDALGDFDEAAVTLFFDLPLGFASGAAAEYVVAPGFVGALLTLQAQGGAGGYVYSVVTGGGLAMDADSRVVSVTGGLTADSAITAVFAVRDGEGSVASLSLHLRVAGSAGDYWDEAMYLIAGHVSGQSGAADEVADVWRSTDGEVWELVNAGTAFSARNSHQAVSYGGSLWVLGGAPGSSRANDVWRSLDGADWTLVTANAGFSARNDHRAVVYRGSMMVIGGGTAAGLTTDVWASADGLDWALVTATAAFGERSGYEAAVYGGSLWVAGGVDADGHSNEVWRSEGGTVWTQAADGGFDGREDYRLVSLGGSLWLTGGDPTSRPVDEFNDVWRSDGSSWVLVTATAAFPPRYGHEMVGYRGSLWVVGGFGNVSGSERRHGDVWRSANGLDWQLVTGTAAFVHRDEFQLVVHQPETDFVYEVREIETTPTGVRTVFLDGTAPVTLATLNASGGSGDLRFELVDDFGAFRIGADDGVVVATSLLDNGVSVSLSVRISDATPINRATAVITVFHLAPLSLSVSMAEYVVSPGFAGEVHVLEPVDGWGGYVYERTAGATAMTVDDEGAILVTGALVAGSRETAVFAVRDGSGGVARFSLRLEVAGSTGEYVEEAMYVIGGGDDMSALRNDIWRSTDGVNWTRIVANAGFSGREDHEAVVFGGKLWVMGGYDNVDPREPRVADVWTTADGANWTLVTAMAAFGDRSSFGLATLGGSLFVFGGVAGGSGLGQQDVWASTDGADWGRVTVSAAFGVRWSMGAVAHGGNLWMSGGSADGSPGQRHDVWRSADGQDWTFVTDAAFTLRTAHEMVSHGGSLWVAGGSNSEGWLADVWASGDNGATWTLKAEGAFPTRSGFGMVSHGGSLWVVGGNNAVKHGDVWASADGERWEQMASGLFDGGREDLRLVVFTPSQFVYERAEIVAEPVSLLVAVVDDSALPLTMATVTASGGVGGLRYRLAADSRGVAALRDDGALVVTAFVDVGERATVTVAITDSTPVNRLEMAVTVVFAQSLSFSPGSAEYVVSPIFAGVVHTLVATNGFGDYRYEAVDADSEVDADSGVVSLTTTLAAGSTVTAVFAAQDGTGGSARFSLVLRVADSAVAFSEEELFLAGGGSGSTDYDDVWRSRDGRSWSAVAVSGERFSARDGHQMVSFDGHLWVIAGAEGDRRDVRRSRDGAVWSLVTATAGFDGRAGHQVVVHRGSLWVVGGSDGSTYYSDVWHSGDGAVWSRATVSAGFAPRSAHEAVVFGGSLWVIGGVGRDSADLADVWRSADGAVWTLVTASAGFSARSGLGAVVHDGSLWVIGGNSGGGEVWRSEDGVTWTSVTVSGSSFSARLGHQVVSSGGSLFLIGGFDPVAFEDKHDVWASANGMDWERLVENAGFSARNGHKVAVHRVSRAFVYRVAEIVVEAPTRTVVVNSRESPPLAVLTLTVSGGDGQFRFELEDAQNAFRLDAGGVLVATNFLTEGSYATVSIRVSDGTPLNAEKMAAVTLLFSPLLEIDPNSADYVVAPDFTGEVHRLAPTGGFGDYSYSRAAGDMSLEVGSAGVVSVATTLAAGAVATAVFVVRDEAGNSVRFALRVEAAADAEGFGEAMFVIGGSDGDNSLRNDIWRSTDGVDWVLVKDTANFSVRSDHGAVAFGGNLWVMGGDDGSGYLGDVWRSANGAVWELVTAAAFPARLAHDVVVFGGSLWVIGGIDSEFNELADVWRSADGEVWELVAAAAAFSARSGHQAVSLGGSLWVVAGLDADGNERDVWRSADGEVWELVTATAAFSVRNGHQMVARDGSLWVAGAFDAAEGSGDDVWWSTDGETWQAATVSAAFLRGRNNHRMAAFGGDLWIVAGRSKSDVWRSTDGANWRRVVEMAAFGARNSHQLVAFTPLVYERATITVTRPDARLTVNPGDALPLTLATLTASGGSGVLRFEVADAKGVVTVNANGALVATAFVGGLATVSVVARDATPLNSAMVVVTMVFVVPLGLGRDSVAYVFSPDYVGAAHTITVTSGTGRYDFERVEGNVALPVDAAGVVSVASALPVVASSLAVFAVTDEAGGSVRFTLSLEVAAAGVYGPGPFVYERTAVVASVSPDLLKVSLDSMTAPIALATLTASGGVGVGGFRFEVAADARMVASVSADGAFVVTNFLQSRQRATVSVVVADSTPVNRATVAVTVVYVAPLRVSPDSARLVVSPNFEGGMYTIMVSGGFGDYSFERVGESPPLGVGDSSGVVLVTAQLTAESEVTAVFAVQDESGGSLRFTLSLRVDGFMPEYVVRDMLLVGGSGRAGNMNDVWRSADGESWSVVTDRAQFSARNEHQVAVFRGALWLSGGKPAPAGNEIWRSVNGREWRKMANIPDRKQHQMVVHDGSLWLIAGLEGGSTRLNDVWRSADGVNWELVVKDAAFLDRLGHQVVSWRGDLWLVGGEASTGLSRRKDNQIWRSGNGKDWTRVATSGSIFSARFRHQLVVHRGSLWVIAGDSGSPESDVWSSADGVSWTRVSDGAFDARSFHQAFSHHGSLWIVGGVVPSGTTPATPFYRNRINDVWRSADGVNWERVAFQPGRTIPADLFSPRSAHQVALFAADQYVYERAEIAVTAPAKVLTVRAGGTPTMPVTVATITASGGAGDLRFEIADAAGVATVDDGGALALTKLLVANTTATVSVVVGDSTPLNRATVVVTLAFSSSSGVGAAEPLNFSPSAARVVMSPDYAGAVYTLAPTGGAGGYVYSQSSGPAGVQVNSFSGEVRVAAGLSTGETVAVFAVFDADGNSVLFTLSLRVDGSGALAEYRDLAMFIMGGNTEDTTNDYQDVLRSTDGERWTSLAVSNPSFLARHNHQAVFHDGSLWIVGGSDNDANYLNDVWRSADGQAWELVTATAAFSTRQGHQVVSFDGDLWLFGGESDDDGDVNDVWRSENGAVWVKEVASAAWGVRRGHEVVFHGGYLWLMGGIRGSGGRKVYYGDVWRSADGKSWEEVTIEGDSWAVRKSHQVVSFGGEMWLMGGKVDDGSANKQGRAHGDVWASSNGVNWRRVVESAPWAARQTHQVVSYHGSLWLMGGYNRQGFRNSEGELEGQSYGDIWRSADGENWESVAVSSPSPFPERRIHQMVVTREPLPFVYQQLAVAVTGPSGALMVTVDGGATAPVTVASLMASGGAGDLRFEMATDAAGVATVDDEGRVAVTKFLAAGTRATVSIVVRDSTPLNRTTVVVTLSFVSSTGFVPGAALPSHEVAAVVMTPAMTEYGGWPANSMGMDDGIGVATAGRSGDGFLRLSDRPFVGDG